MSKQGSTANVIAAICSFFIPGLGQLVQGEILKAIIFFVCAALLYAFIWPLGFIVMIWAVVDAARYSGQK